MWRVNGNLSVSRAIGDPKDKKYVIGEAEVSEIELDGTEDYLVVACDGIWDVVNEEELTSHLEGYFMKGGTKSDAAKSLVNFAYSEGSGDNLTAIIVFFDSFKIPVKPKTVETGSAGTETGSAGTETGSAGTETGSAGTETGSAGTETGSAGTETVSAGTETSSAGNGNGIETGTGSAPLDNN